VTGLVLPSRLDTPAQAFFQMAMGGFGSRFVPVRFGGSFYHDSRASCPQVWRIGAGANMAFRASMFARVGLFDTRLGAGASGCSEDTEMWYRIIATGGACQYEPRAVVSHDHRADWPGLRQQMRAYLNGHVSALVAQFDMFGDGGNLRRIYAQLPAYYVRTLLRTLHLGETERRQILGEEFIGWVTGLRYLIRRRWRRSGPKLPALAGGRPR
jgi:cellulose synthase/poly-beta-1,6-N-acetylglucosamine synthase-like glycosyltransferase